MRICTLLFLLAVLSLAGCGTPGAPLPPSLNLPQPIHDLRAIRKGDTVTLTWTAPQRTTDGMTFRRSGKMTVSRSTAENQPPTVIRQEPISSAAKAPAAQIVTFKDSLAELIRAGKSDFATYKVEATNNLGKGGGPSNQVTVPLVITMTAPANVQASVTANGVNIAFPQPFPPKADSRLNVQYAYRIMRRQQGTDNAVMVSQVRTGTDAMLVVDSGIEWEKSYQYWITPVTLWEKDSAHKGEVEGDDSPVIMVLAHDVFPPAVPTGLQAVFSGVADNQFIDVTWSPNSEPDMAGYNVYRHTENGQPEKINRTLVKTPSFRDSNVHSGTKYFYSVTAVDLRNNESGKSDETSESAPQP